MNFVRKHQTLFRIIVIIASGALILSSLLPLFFGGLG